MTIESQAPADTITPGEGQAGAEGQKTPGEGTPEAIAAATALAAEGAKKDGTTVDAEVKYDFKLPDGVEPDQKSLDEFTKVAKELKLSPESAQKLVDLRSAAVQAAKDQHIATVAGWADEVKADKELGGDKLPESLAIAKKAIDLGPPELKALLEESGLGNHPAVFRWAHSVGKALSEDTFKAGSNAPVTDKSTASVLYGGTTK